MCKIYTLISMTPENHAKDVMPETSSTPYIPYSKPWLTDLEKEAVAASVAAGRLVLGPEVRGFERAVADFVGKKHAVATTSGTTALQLALQAMGVGPGTSVVVPAYTWVATYNVVHWLGAEPILADVDPETFCMTEQSVRRALSACAHARRGIMPVHMFGYRVDPGWLEPLAREEDLLVLGDGCCAFGGEHGGKMCGAWTEVECVSFHPRKIITTGEGGMILLDDDALAQRLVRLRDHGAIRSREQRRQTGAGGTLTPQFPEPGHNLRMTEMQGAMGRAQMARIDEILDARRRVSARYDRLLSGEGFDWLRLPPGSDDPGRLLTCYVPQVWGNRDTPPTPDTPEYRQLAVWRVEIMKALASRGIAARPPMIDLVDLPFSKESKHPEEMFAGTRTIRDLCIGLPYFPEMTDAQVDEVVETLREVASTTDPR